LRHNENRANGGPAASLKVLSDNALGSILCVAPQVLGTTVAISTRQQAATGGLSNRSGSKLAANCHGDNDMIHSSLLPLVPMLAVFVAVLAIGGRWRCKPARARIKRPQR
jgi:hypothetical protein